eukprot:gene35547-45518_t
MRSFSPLVSNTALCAALQQASRDSHRFTFRNAIIALTGKEVRVELADGTVLKGLLHAATLFEGAKQKQVILKAVEVLEAGNPARDVPRGSSLILDYATIVSVQGKPAQTAKVATQEFKTDAATKRKDISHLRGRELEGVST